MINDRTYKPFSHVSGGRAAVLFLLFLIGIYSLYSSGIAGLAAVAMLPVLVIGCYFVFKHEMLLFYVMMVVNYFLHYLARCDYLPIPMSLPNEMLQLMLIFTALVTFKEIKAQYMFNVMTLALSIWCLFCTLEIFNDQFGIGMNVGSWFTGIRLMAFQLVYPCVVMMIYINTPKRIEKFMLVLAILSIWGALWAVKQKEFGFNDAEKVFLIRAARTHFVNGIIRYFSIFSDAANYGIHMASIAIVFILAAITTPLRKKRILYGIVGILCIWGMFLSGTRTAIFCLLAGLGVYIFLSKSVKIAVPFTIVFLLFFIFMAFTKIGNGNPTIRRMRSAFNKEDASLGVREYNKATLKKYMVDAPWGIGIGLEAQDIPSYCTLKIVSQIPPDSEYVYIWVRTGVVGITVFVITTLMMLFGACWNVLFRINNKSLRGLGAGFTCAFVSLQLGGYANQILMQFPNVIIFYGGLALVYIFPYIDKEYTEWEKKELEKQEERKRLKLEKKRASRV